MLSPKTEALIKAMRSEDLNQQELALAIQALETLFTQLGGYFTDETNQQLMASAIVDLRLLGMNVEKGII